MWRRRGVRRREHVEYFDGNLEHVEYSQEKVDEAMAKLPEV